MKTVYIYAIETLADWELGYITAELNSRRFFKIEAPPLVIKMVSSSKEAIYTIGGLKIEPDCTLEEIQMSSTTTLLLPGADCWKEPKHQSIIQKASELLDIGATVCAICGATTALADAKLLNTRTHTSNGAGFLEMFSPSYTGGDLYLDEPSVWDKNLITASSTGALLWTKQILEHLEVFAPDTLEAWYQYFKTGESSYFFSLIQSLPPRN